MVSLYRMASGVTPFGNLGMGTAAHEFGVQNAVAGFAVTAFMCAAVLGIGSRRVRAL
jgi:hypothetical protein